MQQIAILMGCAILPHLRNLVEIIEHGLVDEQQKVRTITALALAALAESASSMEASRARSLSCAKSGPATKKAAVSARSRAAELCISFRPLMGARHI